MAEDNSLLTTILTGISSSLEAVRADLSELRRDFAKKADVSHVIELEHRVTSIEQESAASRAVENALRAVRSGRKAVWIAIGSAAVTFLFNITYYIIIK